MASAGVLAMLGAPTAHADKIDDAAKKLSVASYPFLKEIDWISDVFVKLPTANGMQVPRTVDKMIVMGAAMDSVPLKAGGLAHHKAIGSIDGKGVTSLGDYTAVNAAIGMANKATTSSRRVRPMKAIIGMFLQVVPG
jgi:hypothetical protein